MEKNIKNLEVVGILNGLNTFIQKDKDVPFKVYRAVTKNHKTLMNEYEIYDKVRRKIITECGNNEKECLEKMQALLDEEVTVGIDMIPESVLEDVELSIKDRLALDFMVEGE